MSKFLEGTFTTNYSPSLEEETRILYEAKSLIEQKLDPYIESNWSKFAHITSKSQNDLRRAYCRLTSSTSLLGNYVSETISKNLSNENKILKEKTDCKNESTSKNTSLDDMVATMKREGDSESTSHEKIERRKYLDQKTNDRIQEEKVTKAQEIIDHHTAHKVFYDKDGNYRGKGYSFNTDKNGIVHMFVHQFYKDENPDAFAVMECEINKKNLLVKVVPRNARFEEEQDTRRFRQSIYDFRVNLINERKEEKERERKLGNILMPKSIKVIDSNGTTKELFEGQPEYNEYERKRTESLFNETKYRQNIIDRKRMFLDDALTICQEKPKSVKVVDVNGNTREIFEDEAEYDKYMKESCDTSEASQEKNAQEIYKNSITRKRRNIQNEQEEEALEVENQKKKVNLDSKFVSEELKVGSDYYKILMEAQKNIDMQVDLLCKTKYPDKSDAERLLMKDEIRKGALEQFTYRKP